MTDRKGRPGALFLLGLVIFYAAPVKAAEREAVYSNPIIHADYSDPDALCTDDGYYLTSSSFSHVPALPILHSKDLVNWEIVNHAIDRLPPGDYFDTPRPGEGVWAPSFREHGGRFFIYYGDPDFGIYVVTAEDPRGEWSEPKLILPGKGLIDPAPFWDDDGKAYLVHAWAKSRAGFNNVLTLHRMSPDGLEILDEGRVVIDGNQLEGWRTVEGPKLYKKDGFYYVFAPAGGVRNGWQGAFRSKSIYGPYEHRIVLEQGDTAVNGPHQGAWVKTPDGDDWFLHFQDKDSYGRIVHLQPMRWVDDWPVMGADPDGNGTGKPVLQYALPLPELASADVQLQTSDAFENGFRAGPADIGDPVRAQNQAVDVPLAIVTASEIVGEIETLFRIGGAARVEAIDGPADGLLAGGGLQQHLAAAAIDHQTDAILAVELVEQHLQRLFDHLEAVVAPHRPGSVDDEDQGRRLAPLGTNLPRLDPEADQLVPRTRRKGRRRALGDQSELATPRWRILVIEVVDELLHPNGFRRR